MHVDLVAQKEHAYQIWDRHRQNHHVAKFQNIRRLNDRSKNGERQEQQLVDQR